MSLTSPLNNRSTEEWEQAVGTQIHALRVRKRVDQKELANLANVSISAIKNLEGGKGSTLKTFIRVLRALGHTDLLEAIQPAISVSPLDVVRTGKTSTPLRVVKPRRIKISRASLAAHRKRYASAASIDPMLRQQRSAALLLVFA